jgi:hypothetical protein
MAGAFCASLSGSPRGGRVHLLQFGLRREPPPPRHARAALPVGGALRRDFARLSSTAGVASVRTSAGQFSIQAGPETRQAEIAFIADAFTLPLSSGVTIISIVPNGQATTQALQPMHFC